MRIATKRGQVDLNKVVFLDTYNGNFAAVSDGLHIALSDPEDQLLAEYFFTNAAISGDDILRLAEQIQAIRNPVPVQEIYGDYALAERIAAGMEEAPDWSTCQ